MHLFGTCLKPFKVRIHGAGYGRYGGYFKVRFPAKLSIRLGAKARRTDPFRTMSLQAKNVQASCCAIRFLLQNLALT